MSKLPQWLEEILPEKAPHYTLDFDEKTEDILFIEPSGNVQNLGKDLSVAGPVTSGKDFVITQKIYDKFNNGARHFLTYSSGGNYSTMIMESTDELRYESLVRAYDSFLNTAEKYLENPKDFYKAYNFIDQHPAFWDSNDYDKNPWYWNTEGHCMRLYQAVYMVDGQLIVELETGSVVEKEWRGHYHDWRLDSSGRTFEEAYVELASKVHKAHNLDGSDRNNEDDFEKPEWIKTLEERIQDIE